MTAEQYARMRQQDPRYRGKIRYETQKVATCNIGPGLGSSTLPRTSTTRTNEAGEKVAAATSSTSLYDNVASGQAQAGASGGAGTQTGSSQEATTQRPKSETGTMTGDDTIITAAQNHVGAQIQTEGGTATLQRQESKSEGTQAGGTLQQTSKMTTSTGTGTRNKDYGDECPREGHDHHNIINNNARRSKSKSTEDMNGKKLLDWFWLFPNFYKIFFIVSFSFKSSKSLFFYDEILRGLP